MIMDPFGLWVMFFVPAVGGVFAWTSGVYMFVVQGGWRPQWLWLFMGCGLLGALALATSGYGWLLGVLFCGSALYEFVPSIQWSRRLIDPAKPWERIGFAVVGTLIMQVAIGALVVAAFLLASTVPGIGA